MIYMPKDLGGNIVMSATSFKMHSEIRWVHGWMVIRID
jgi:hypothetical protein